MQPSTNSPMHRRKARPGRTGSVLALAAAVALAVLPSAAAAQGSRISIARDAEAEALLNDYLRPLARAAGVSTPTVMLVPSPAFNAFVTGRGNMFVNTGAIIESNTPNELIGVLAHETAHIANQDAAQMTQQLEDTKVAMLLASLVGVGAVAASAATGNTGVGQAGSGLLSATASLGMRSLLRYQRDKEAAADRSAVRYLDATGQSAAGMLATLQRLADDSLLISQSANPYLLSHPLPRERVVELESMMSRSPHTGKRDPAELQTRHDLVRAKLIGFTWTAQNLQRRYPLGDNSLAARYARAIMAFRTGQPAQAVQQIDALIAAAPNYAYFHELKGQALLETGNPKAAIAPLRKAASLANSNLLKILLGQALVATGERGAAQEAVQILAPAMQSDPDISAGYRALARAYAILDDVPMAQLATAQGLFAEGNFREAKMQAERAQAQLKTGTPAWLRADDIVSYNPPK